MKYHVLSTWFQKTYEEKDQFVSYFISIGINIGACLTASLCCVMAPEAVGSGIPQIKSYLNGGKLLDEIPIYTIETILDVYFSQHP